ncbi:MAG: 3-keto-disaccharide hydrolase [Coraliomargaritaceae bacterium]
MKYLTALLLSVIAYHSIAAAEISPNQQIYIEKYEKQKSILAPEDVLLNQAEEPDLSIGFVDLYNSKDLSGWAPRGGNCSFAANGDVIVGTCVPGSPSTYLCTTKEDYKDFIFSAEVKWIQDGNSGIIFRSKRQTVEGPHERVFGPQCEMEGFSPINGVQRGWSGGIYGQGYAGWIYPLWLNAHEEVRNALKKDEWNRVTIQAIGTNVKTWINGIPAAHWEDDRFQEGFFGLQIHSGNSGEVHFRKIKVRDLSPVFSGEDLFEDGDFRKWTKVNGTPVTSGWSIDEGVIARSGLKVGSIITKDHYKDFDLRFEWKIADAGNSGVKYRSKRNLGLEYQILDDTKHRNGNDPLTSAASMYALAAANVDKELVPVGEWNQARIVARGNQVQHWLNGKLVLEADLSSENWIKQLKQSKFKEHVDFGHWTGPILLQDHSDPVWFRNVRIQKL